MVRTSSTPTTMMRSTAGSPDQRQRPKIAAMETGPGPACYLLPGTCGGVGHDISRRQNPSFSFGVKTKQFSSMSLASQRYVAFKQYVHIALTIYRGKMDATEKGSLHIHEWTNE